MCAAEAALRAKEQLIRITGLEPDYVSAVSKGEDGWRVTINFVELQRIPAATDVLAAYEARLDEEGNLMSYHRGRRYFRDQVIEES